MSHREHKPEAAQRDTSLPEDRVPLPPDPVIEVYKRDIDRTLLRENLKLTPEQRLLQLMDFQRFFEELQKAGRNHT